MTLSKLPGANGSGEFFGFLGAVNLFDMQRKLLFLSYSKDKKTNINQNPAN